MELKHSSCCKTAGQGERGRGNELTVGQICLTGRIPQNEKWLTRV